MDSVRCCAFYDLNKNKFFCSQSTIKWDKPKDWAITFVCVSVPKKLLAASLKGGISGTTQSEQP